MSLGIQCHRGTASLTEKCVGPTSSPGIIAGDTIPVEASPAKIPQRQITGETTLGHFSGYGNLPLPRFGAWFESDQHILQLKLYEDPMNEVVSNLFRATLFLPPDILRLLRQEAQIFTEEAFLLGGGAVNVLSHIRRIFIDILGINLEFFEKLRIQL